jgi:putative sterol carrier protein
VVVVPSAKEVFAEIQERLTANPEKTKGMNAVYQFDLSGDEGGQWHIAINDGTASVKEGQAESPNVTITMSASDFVDMATGKLDGTMAFMSGKLKLKGDMGLAMKLQSLLR